MKLRVQLFKTICFRKHVSNTNLQNNSNTVDELINCKILSTQFSFRNACFYQASISGQMLSQEHWLWFVYSYWMNGVRNILIKYLVFIAWFHRILIHNVCNLTDITLSPVHVFPPMLSFSLSLSLSLQMHIFVSNFSGGGELQTNMRSFITFYINILCKRTTIQLKLTWRLTMSSGIRGF